MKTALDPRHTNRQKAVQELFAVSFHKQSSSSDLAKKVSQNFDVIDKLIAQSAPEFPIDRINPVDLAVLRLAVYEMVIVHSEPPKVVIDEAIELAKEFGGENSPAFINGALGKVLLSPERIKKLIADFLGAEEKYITPEADFKTDLNATDIEIADLLETLGVEKNTRICTVGDLFAYVEDHKD